MAEPLIFNFEPDDHFPPVDFAWNVAKTWRDVSRVQVVDAYGMLIAQFCAAWIYLGVDKFNDKKMARRPPQPEFPQLRPGSMD
jgi:hypothetical protein